MALKAVAMRVTTNEHTLQLVMRHVLYASTKIGREKPRRRVLPFLAAVQKEIMVSTTLMGADINSKLIISMFGSRKTTTVENAFTSNM